MEEMEKAGKDWKVLEDELKVYNDRMVDVYVRRADIPWTGRGGAAAATRIFRGAGSRRRRGCDADIPWRRVAAAPRLRRGCSVATGRGWKSGRDRRTP